MTDWIAKLDELGDGERRLIITIAKGWLAKGEDPSVVLGIVKKWIAKNSDDGATEEGTKPPDEQRDPARELEDLVDEQVAARGISRSKAYNEVLRSRRDLNSALAAARDKKLRKAAQAAGGNYGAA
jgi:hypothetical protein